MKTLFIKILVIVCTMGVLWVPVFNCSYTELLYETLEEKFVDEFAMITHSCEEEDDCDCSSACLVDCGRCVASLAILVTPPSINVSAIDSIPNGTDLILEIKALHGKRLLDPPRSILS